MIQKLGYLSSYGIEDIYFFLGKGKVENKIIEMKDIPTMGIPIEEFLNGEQGILGSNGVFYCFDTLLSSYFIDDIELAVFLFEKSKSYTEDNYFSTNFLQESWSNHIKGMDRMIKKSPESEGYWNMKKINPFWNDLHFFYMTLANVFNKVLKQKEILKLNFAGDYILEKGKLLGACNLEIKIRKKPLTGKYLTIKDLGFKTKSWFNLDYVETSEEKYIFKKYSGTYLLTVKTKDKTAVINLLDIDMNLKIREDYIMQTNLDFILEELGNLYMKNFMNISKRVELEFKSLNKEALLVNGVLSDLINYYERNGNEQKVFEIKKLNNSYPNIWRPFNLT